MTIPFQTFLQPRFSQSWPSRSGDFGAKVLSLPQALGRTRSARFAKLPSGFLQGRRGEETVRREVDLQKQNVHGVLARGFLVLHWQIAILIPIEFFLVTRDDAWVGEAGGRA